MIEDVAEVSVPGELCLTNNIALAVSVLNNSSGTVSAHPLSNGCTWDVLSMRH